MGLNTIHHQGNVGQTLPKIAPHPNQDSQSARADDKCWRNQASRAADGSVPQSSHLGKSLAVPTNLPHGVATKPHHPTPRCVPGEVNTHVQTETCTRMFMVE